jgi:hypothetical protein
MMVMSPRVRSVLRWTRIPALLVATYLVCRIAFAALTVDDGLLTPGGAPRLGVAALGLLTLLLRVVVLFGLPAAATHRLVMALLQRTTVRQGR